MSDSDRAEELESTFKHTFCPDNIGKPEPPSDWCLHCSLNIRDGIHARVGERAPFDARLRGWLSEGE